MKNLSYFDAYMRGERSRDYRNRQWISQYGQYSQYVRQLMGLYYSPSYGWQHLDR